MFIFCLQWPDDNGEGTTIQISAMDKYLVVHNNAAIQCQSLYYLFGCGDCVIACLLGDVASSSCSLATWDLGLACSFRE